ncbi:MAG: Type 1 glutamine amidotransferase-like domain-containing protein [Devosia nanyangense]|uniref:Type 1 glutamine amidotransferase-like domain-containing protein n=1 Tax=Devosia nanyangense TaxID=1228055 RepID=A0A933L340_9HYPH|nr:Type 1 glutamine amidotransferase-like domain-containing protein [Devosia nanyangense]
MRLYLSSERLGERAGALLAMLPQRAQEKLNDFSASSPRPVKHRPRVAIIANGYDSCSAMARDIYRTEVYDPVAEFRSLGLEPDELDLRAHFGDPESLRTRIGAYDLVWVMGGNSFVLRRAMRSSGFDRIIADLLEADAIAYGDYAAGAIVAGPTLRGMELMDDPFELPDRYDEPLIWHGLHLTPFTIVPHYRSRHPDSAAAEKVVSYMEARKARYRALSDGEVIVRVGNLERLAS